MTNRICGGQVGFARRLAAGMLLPLISVPIALTKPLVVSAAAYGYHYSQQWTAQSGYGGFYHPPSGWQNHAYTGWAGIDGQILTPTHYPFLGGTINNHSVGWLEVSFAMTGPNTDSWFQIGWLAGCISGGGQPVCGSPQLKLYDEGSNALYHLYFAQDDGPLGYSYAAVYRVEVKSDGCWYAYKNYNVLVDFDCSFVGSGAGVVSSEVWAGVGGPVEMPTTIYGYSDPNTNNALRLRGANGYVPWTSALSSGETSAYDERYSAPDYWISDFTLYYKFESYGQCSPNC